MNTQLIKKATAKIQLQAVKKSVSVIRVMTLYLLRIKYGWGNKRLTEFDNHFKDLFEMIGEDYVSLADMGMVLKDESDFEFDRISSSVYLPNLKI